MSARRLILATLFLGAIASQALPADKAANPPKRAPIVYGDGAEWVAHVRFDVSGVLLEEGPHVQVLCTTAMGKAGAPASMTAGGSSGVMMAITPEEARELADALNAWADNPTDSVVFSRVR